MSFQYISDEDDIPSDNFKININGELAKPYGNFIEEIMVWIDNERARLGIDPFDWHIYDKYTPVESGGIGLHDDFEGNPWEYDVDQDVQRVLFTPSLTQTKVSGYYAPIRNYVGDLASGLYPVVARYAGMTDFIEDDYETHKETVNIICRRLGFNTAVIEDNTISELREIITPSGTDFNPETDDNVNTCRPKACLPILFSDRIAIYNVLNAFLDPSGSLELDEQNKVCEWNFRDENLAQISGATALWTDFGPTFPVDLDSVFYTQNFYVAFGDEIRAYDAGGKPLILGGGTTYSITLDDTTSSFIKNFNDIFYLDSNGDIRSHSISSPSDPEVSYTVTYTSDNGLSVLTYSTGTFNPPGPAFDVIVKTPSTTASASSTTESNFDVIFSTSLIAYKKGPFLMRVDHLDGDFDMFDFDAVNGLNLIKDNKIYNIITFGSGAVVNQTIELSEGNISGVGLLDIDPLEHTIEDYNSSGIVHISDDIFEDPIWHSPGIQNGLILYGSSGIFYESSWHSHLTDGIAALSSYYIRRDKAIGDGSPPGVPPGTGGSNAYSTASISFTGGFVQHSNRATVTASPLWSQREQRMVYRFDCRTILDNLNNYDSQDLEISFLIYRPSAAIIKSTSHSSPPDPSTTWNSPNGGLLESVDVRANIYTGSWPPAASSSDFNALGSVIMTQNVPANKLHTGFAFRSSVSELHYKVTVPISDLDISIDGFLYIICSQDTITHNRASPSSPATEGEIYIVPQGISFGGNFNG